eukprot:TRINITY_DN6896_c0_g1_i3.p1 TRINITY_DN6896_c0_g1~~TRINITY_DN6896_c0_g1_i3.p1  ORF type:complete len:285 (+),score=51.95 TRINITY_DN6896_c0_g1_i3:79-855(+)
MRDPDSKRFFGSIIRFNPKTGWGYIDCPPLKSEYGKDVFLHKQYMDRDFDVGDTVNFTIELSEEGMPQARDIKPHQGNRQPQQSSSPANNSGRFFGSIIRFNPKSGWGYIDCPPLKTKYGKDVFLHKQYMDRDFDVGDTVNFTIELSEEGMPQARDIKPHQGNHQAQQPAASSRTPERFFGSIVSFNAKTGWGYIDCPPLKSKYGKDVFLHRDHMEREFSVGDTVKFAVQLSEEGMPQARDIQPFNATASRKRKASVL